MKITPTPTGNNTINAKGETSPPPACEAGSAKVDEREPTVKHRIRWNDVEVGALSQAIVAERIADPFATQLALVNRAQTKCLPADRRRKSASIPDELRARILADWKSKITDEGKELPAPVILSVETPKELDYAEALAALDGATLVALLVRKLGNEMAGIQTQLSAIGERLGAPPAPRSAKPSHASPLPRVPSKAQKRKPRVAIIGPLDGQMEHIERQIEDQQIAVEVRFVDKEASSPALPPSCDFVIVTRHSRHKWFETARNKCDNRKVFFVDGGITQVMQKLRDIASRQ